VQRASQLNLFPAHTAPPVQMCSCAIVLKINVSMFAKKIGRGGREQGAVCVQRASQQDLFPAHTAPPPTNCTGKHVLMTLENMFVARNGCRVRGAENGVRANIPGATPSVSTSQGADRHKKYISILYE